MNTFAADRPKSPRRKRAWSRIEKNLVERGSITVWVDPEMIPLWEHPERTGKPGRPARYHDAAITTGYAVKAVYHLPWRQTEGFMRSIFRLMDLPLAVPDSTTFSRRMPGLTIEMPRRPESGEAVHIVIDSTGLKIFGAGEWHMHKCSGPIVCRSARKGISPK
jgi:hypothetical protein